MAGISRETVAHVADLARLKMTEEELDTLAAELDVILKSVDQVNEAALDDIPPTSHPIPLTNVYRDDVVGPVLTREEALSGAPDAFDGQFRVPTIIDGE